MSFFVTADIDERTRRVQARYKKRFGFELEVDKIRKDIEAQDHIQAERMAGMPHAPTIDTTNRDPEDAVAEMLRYVQLSTTRVRTNHWSEKDPL